jgi:hypothetical protein
MYRWMRRCRKTQQQKQEIGDVVMKEAGDGVKQAGEEAMAGVKCS